MLSWHKVGQHVICVDATPLKFDLMFPGKGEHPRLTQDKEYVISSIGVFVEDKVEVTLEGLGKNYFKVGRFRPVYPQIIDDLRRSTAPSLDKKLEPVT